MNKQALVNFAELLQQFPWRSLSGEIVNYKLTKMEFTAGVFGGKTTVMRNLLVRSLFKKALRKNEKVMIMLINSNFSEMKRNFLNIFCKNPFLKFA